MRSGCHEVTLGSRQEHQHQQPWGHYCCHQQGTVQWAGQECSAGRGSHTCNAAPAIRGRAGAAGQDCGAGTTPVRPTAPPEPRETHSRGRTIARNCLVTDFPGAGSCPGGGWRLPWRPPVELRLLSASPPTPTPGWHTAQHRPGPGAPTCVEGLQIQQQ